MSELTEHYRVLLGLDADWRVEQVDFSLEEKKVEIRLEHIGGSLCCPECEASCPQADLAPERLWRHLDTMQFQTIIRSRIPRSKCPQCGVKTIAVPWADKHSRFTLLFEAFAIGVLNASANVQRAAVLLDLDWQTTHGIMQRAVKRGLKRRSLEEVQHVGIDEKSFGRGHDYVSVMTDLDESRVLEVVKDRTQEAADALWNSLPKAQREKVLGVAMDMWQPYFQTVCTAVPNGASKIVFDRFHIVFHMNKALDIVRRRELRELLADDDRSLVGTKHAFLYAAERLDDEVRQRFVRMRNAGSKTARAWSIKEMLRGLWDCATERAAVPAKISRTPGSPSARGPG